MRRGRITNLFTAVLLLLLVAPCVTVPAAGAATHGRTAPGATAPKGSGSGGGGGGGGGCQGAAHSTNVAMVPDALGETPSARPMPTSGTVAGVPGDSFDQFSFTDLPIANIDAASLGQFDTVVLVNVNPQDLTTDQQTALANFVASGCKLIIHDAGVPASATGGVENSYDWLPGADFSTSNLCAFCFPDVTGAGSTGIVENNAMISDNPSDPSFIDVGEIALDTDAASDSNQFAALNGWFTDADAGNGMNLGPVHAYTRVNGGLIIYNGYDNDDIGLAEQNGVDWLGKLWYQELALGWNPDNLPGSNPQTINTFAPRPQAGGGSPSVPIPPACKSFPVNCFDGEFWHTFTDMSIPGRGLALSFSRTYSTVLATEGAPSSLGPGWTDNYNMSLKTDAAGNATVTEETGSSVTFTPASGGGYTAPSFIQASLVKNSDGTFTFSRNNQTHYTFSATGQLLKETDRNGYATTLSYTGGQLSSVTDPAGRQLTFSYDGAGHLVKVTDPIGRSVSFSYDAAGNLQTATDVGGGQTQFTYDSAHRMLTLTDPNGGELTNVYDSTGRVVQQTDPLGRVTKFAYQTGVQTTITDPRGNVTVEKFRNDQLVSRTLGAGTPAQATFSYTYDPTTLEMATLTDPNGHVTTNTYDARGNLLTSEDPLGRTTTNTYDNLNDITSTTDPLGVTTTKTYDSNGNLLTSSTPLTGTNQVATTTDTYGDPAHPGDVTAMTDADGNVTHYAYDQFGNQVSSTDPAGDITTYSYDAIGRRITTVTPRGNLPGADPAKFRTTLTYNAFGDPLTVTDPLGRTTTYTYDANTNKTSVTDSNGHTTHYTYDAGNELVATIRPDGSTLHNAYDAAGNLTAQTDGLGHTTTFQFDALNRKISETDALGRTTTYSYDPAGNLTSVTDPMDRTTTYGYDAANERTSINYSDGNTPNVTFAYNADGQRTAMTDGTGQTTYTYDSLHRLTSSTNGAGATVRYTYPLRDLLTGITYPGGTNTVNRGFDAAGRLTSITDWLGNTSRFSYDANGNLVKAVYPNGTTTFYTYNRADEVTRITAARGDDVFLDFSYSRNQAGEVTAENFSPFTYDPNNRLTSAGDVGYAYDGADRLTSVSGQPGNLPALTGVPGGLASLAREAGAHAASPAGPAGAAGPGRLAGPANLPEPTLANTYDAADELTQQTVGPDGDPPQISYGYDANGNRTSAMFTLGSPFPPASLRYQYDQANRLVGFTGFDGDTTTYAYNGDGLRQGKTNEYGTTPFAWNVAQGLPFLLQDGATSYVAGPSGLPLEQISPSGRVLFYHADQLGSTRALTDSYGNVVARYTYDGYGNTVAAFPLASRKGVRSGDAGIVNPFQYTGEYRDPESGLYYLRSRYYDPRTGQFVSVDPMHDQTRERYTYVTDDPVNHQDPTGQITAGFCLGGSVGLGVWGGFGQGCVQTATKDPVLSLGTAALYACLDSPIPPLNFLGCEYYYKSITSVGFTVTGGGGPQLLTMKPPEYDPGATGLAQMQFSNGKSISDLAGWFCYANGQANLRGPIVMGGSVFSGVCPPPNDLHAGFNNLGNVTNGFDIGLGGSTQETPSLGVGSSYTWCWQHNVPPSTSQLIP